jgi:hypothetical protein
MVTCSPIENTWWCRCTVGYLTTLGLVKKMYFIKESLKNISTRKLMGIMSHINVNETIDSVTKKGV